jgi:HD-GYP domain-containing protein (c-di-GMP phosphodiesterase class II)
LSAAASQVGVYDAVKALAFVGDLSMGQPIDHSARTAWLAAQIAAALGLDAEAQSRGHLVALLRWSGCTANAAEFSELMGDDVNGRRLMFSTPSRELPAAVRSSIGALAEIHCEVSGDVARALGLSSQVEHGLRHMFQSFDGQGKSSGLHGHDIPVEVFLVGIAGDLEIFSRVHGLERAIGFIQARADVEYPAYMVAPVARHAADWLHSLERGAASQPREDVASTRLATVPLELIADVIDLKLPWLTGFSRKAASAAARCAAALGLDLAQQQRIYRAGLVHGMGRASVPNSVWDSTVTPSEGMVEQVRLVPYWTSRAVQRIGSLSDEAEIASFIDERLDGSGFFRGAGGDAIRLECQVLAAAVHGVMLQTARPGRPALSADEAARQLRSEAAQGRFAVAVVEALLQKSASAAPREPAPVAASALSAREVEVLSRVSLGESNKEAARALGISPSTVRAHLENVFRKLECTTRAAATLKALRLGLLEAVSPA